MNSRSYWLGLLVVIAVTLSAALASGRLNQRWGAAPSLKQAAEKLDRVPVEFGDWVMSSESELEPRTIEMLQCAGSVNRVYVNRVTGQTVSMSIIVGPAGPTSVHTPEICYSSRDYNIVAEPSRFQLGAGDGAKDEYWEMTLRSRGVQGHMLRVAYAWSTGGSWSAPSQPRFRFGGARQLYKLQLAGQFAPADASTDQDPCRAFLRDFSSVLDDALNPSAAKS